MYRNHERITNFASVLSGKSLCAKLLPDPVWPVVWSAESGLPCLECSGAPTTPDLMLEVLAASSAGPDTCDGIPEGLDESVTFEWFP